MLYFLDNNIYLLCTLTISSDQEIVDSFCCSAIFNIPCIQFSFSGGLFYLFVFYRTTCFFFIWVFFHKHLQFTGQQGKEVISVIPLYQFHPLHRHLDVSRAITAVSSPLHIVSSQTRTRNLWFPSTSR